jgi:uncharacterized delta-60 repeat protein
MVRLHDGRMVFFGRANDASMMLLAVLQADGASLDPSVGSGNGFLIFQFNGTSSQAAKVLEQADGKILIAGAAIGPNGNLDMAVARFLPDFSGFDPAFGTGGYRTIAFDLGGPSGDNSDYVNAMALQADGRIVLAGIAVTSPVSADKRTGDSAIARLLANGQLDTSFGPNHDGRVHYAPASVGFPNAALVDRQGRIVIGGYGADPSNSYSEWSIDRLQPDGSQDPGFNGGSAQQFLVRPGQTSSFQFVSALALQSDGKILAAGTVAHDSGDSNQYWGAARLLGDGTLDLTFGTGGAFFGAPGRSYGSFTPGSVLGYQDVGTAIAIGNGGIMVAGNGQVDFSGAASKIRFGLAKLQLDLIFSDGFE